MNEEGWLILDADEVQLALGAVLFMSKLQGITKEPPEAYEALAEKLRRAR